MISPQVSVIVVTFNSSSLLADCLSPLEAACLSGRLEVIVVDNDSNDNPEQVLQELGVPTKFEQTGGNLGFAAAVNIGARLARGDFVLLLNPDIEHRESILFALVDRLENDDSIGAIAPILVTPGVETANGGRQPTLKPMLAHATGLARLVRRIIPSFGHYAYTEGIRDQSLVVEWLSGGYLLTRAPLDGRNLLSERWFMYAEDIDLSRSLTQRSLRLVLCGDLRATHSIGGSSSSSSEHVRTMWIENLRDYYETAFSPNWLTLFMWRVTVSCGYATRSLYARVSRQKERARQMAAYASAVWARPQTRSRKSDIAPISTTNER